MKSIVGIDISKKFILFAKKTAEINNIENAEFMVGDMFDMPFDDASFDAVLLHTILYQLDKKSREQVLKGAMRVLQPGGVIGVRDADEGGTIIYPMNEQLEHMRALWAKWHGWTEDNLFFGRKLREVLSSSGFEMVYSGASFDNHTSTKEDIITVCNDMISFTSEIAKDLILHDKVKKRELETILDGIKEWGRNKNAFYVRCRCEAVARKPIK